MASEFSVLEAKLKEAIWDVLPDDKLVDKGDSEQRVVGRRESGRDGQQVPVPIISPALRARCTHGGFKLRCVDPDA